MGGGGLPTGTIRNYISRRSENRNFVTFRVTKSTLILKEIRYECYDEKLYIRLGKGEGKFPMSYTIEEIPINVTVSRSFIAYEGTYIRVHKYDGVWHLSTFKRIDARTSKWGTCKKSFGSIFLQRVGGLSSLVPNLNPNHKYLFQITYPHGYGGVCTPTDKV